MGVISQLASNDKWVVMNTPERIQFEKEIGLDTGQGYDLLSRTNVNWLDEVFNDRAPLQSYELSVNRATDRLNYYVSGGFMIRKVLRRVLLSAVTICAPMRK